MGRLLTDFLPFLKNNESHNNSIIIGKGKGKPPLSRPTWPIGVQEVKAPRFLDTRHMKVVRPPLPPGISWYSFLEAESTPGHMKLSESSEKIPSDTTGDRSRDLPTSSAAP
jgi:hypothetical protein